MSIKGAVSTPLYEQKPVPSDPNELPVYLNDELLKIGGLINAILEGSAFPPQVSIPKRVKEGMIVLYSQPILPDITEAGLYIRINSTWKRFNLAP